MTMPRSGHVPSRGYVIWRHSSAARPLRGGAHPKHRVPIVAIEIPTLLADRLPRPEWGPSAPTDRYQLSADRLLQVLETLSIPDSVRSALRSVAQTGASVDVLLASDRSSLQILVGGWRLTLVGAARDAVLTLLDQDAGLASGRVGPTAGALAGALLDVSTAARSASVDAQIQESRALPPSASPELLEATGEQAATVITAPLMDAAGQKDVGSALARAIDSSGLFLEAHFAQMLRGERSLQAILGEAGRLPVDAQPDGAQAADRRSALQLDAMQRQAISLIGQAWAGQPFRIQIERDRERNREAANAGDATGLFVATLTMRLANLGQLCAHIRVVENTVGVQIESDQPAALGVQLPQLASSLSARGLTVAQLAAVLPAVGDV